MRKIYLILAIAGIMMTTACSNENNEPVIPTDEANVTFTVNLEGIESRAISDGTTVDQLIFSVFDSEGNEITSKRQNDIQIVNRQATVTTRMQIGRTFTFVFWAQKKKEGSLNDNGYYNTTNLKDIVVNYEGYANDESRDAFCAKEIITIGTKTVNRLVVLTRPFAQVDYVCDITEWTNLLNSNYKLLGSELVVDAGAYTHYNVLTGEATEPTTTPITFKFSDYWETHQINTFNFCGFVSSKPGETYQDLFATTDGDMFWLTMNYILATPEVTNLGHTTMNIYCWGSEGPTPVVVDLDEVPIKRNHRTVVHVSDLTRIVTAIVTIDPSFWGDL